MAQFTCGFTAPCQLPTYFSRRDALVHKRCLHRQPLRASYNGFPRSSTALNQEDSSNRYIDLRTMQVIRAGDAHLCDSPNWGVTFGAFDNPALFDDPATAKTLRQLIFNSDTVPLSESQREVVLNLLAGRSVLYTAAVAHEKENIVIDIVMRARLWKERVVYCAHSQRAAEAMFAVLCAQLGVERRGEVLLDFGSGYMQRYNAPEDSLAGVRVVITSPIVLRNNIIVGDAAGWMSDASIVFVDSFSASELQEWEELLLAMPSKLLLCVFAKELCRGDQELLPLWLETVQNSLVSVSPDGATSLLDRFQRPQEFPLLRTFVYNAAVHETPVQVSLNMLKNIYHQELQIPSGEFVPQYSECFLHGITMISAEDASALMFRSVEEAEFADICSLVVADAKRVFLKAKTRRKRSKSIKRKERTASSRAAARRRRESAYSDALLFPAIALVKGRKETLFVAKAIQSALDSNPELIWDDDTREHLESIVNSYKASHEGQLCSSDEEALDALMFGVGVINEATAPTTRSLVEELFRGGFVPLIVVDTHLGSAEVAGLPCAKSVLLESSCMATCDDLRRGLLMTSTAASLAGRPGKDDVGNLIVLWYDESVGDETAGYEIASTLLNPVFAEEEHAIKVRRRARSYGGGAKSSQIPIKEAEMRSSYGLQSPLSSSYDGVLRAVRRFGLDGYESIVEYTLSAFRGWLERAALQATLEKMSVERKAIEERLEEEDWSSIADHERREAKMNEVGRVFKAMECRFDAVRSGRLLNELRRSRVGRIIGVKYTKQVGSGAVWEPKLLESTVASNDIEQKKDQGQETSKEERERKDFVTLTKEGQRTGESLCAAGFVSVIDQSIEGRRIEGLDSRYLVVCIVADGRWTVIPLSDVVALADDEEEVLPNVDLLMMPHPATFDVDPHSGWGKCRPIDDTEREAVDRIADELIAKVAGEDRPRLVVFKVSEFEDQRERMEMVQNLHKQSPWYGRDDEIVELQRLRRRSAKMSDEISWLEKTENQLKEELFNKHNTHRSIQSSLMAILEDCHAVHVLGDQSMQITPLGSLAALLPSEFPVFAAACLTLIDDIETLSPSQMASFVAVVSCSGREWDRESTENDEFYDESGDEPLDLSIIRRSPEREGLERVRGAEVPDTAEVDEVGPFLPVSVRHTINDIQQALYQLHRRHLDENHVDVTSISDIVPQILNIRMAEAFGAFAGGVSWREAIGMLGEDSRHAVREIQRVKSVLGLISKNANGGEFSQNAMEIARRAYDSMNKWPVEDSEMILKLVDEGVVEKRWSGSTYDKWWRGSRDSLAKMNGEAARRFSSQIESVQTEVLESS